jgi:23S rRNA maturation mini-RNase III
MKEEQLKKHSKEYILFKQEIQPKIIKAMWKELKRVSEEYEGRSKNNKS